MASLQPQATQATLPKRKRLSYACNYCRQKKTRCDEQQPTCRACEVAGVECITTDKQRPHAEVLSRLKRVAARRERDRDRDRISPASVQVPDANSDTMRPATVTATAAAMAPTHQHLPMMPSSPPQAETDTVRQTTQWLETAFARLNHPRLQQLLAAGIKDLYLHRSLPAAAATGTPLSQVLTFPGPDLPLPDDLRRHADFFLDHVQPIYPFVARASVAAMLDRLSAPPLLVQDVPALAFAYLICAFAMIADPASAPSLDMAETYLLYVNTLVGQLITTRSVASVQAILLFCIVLRARDHLAWSWDLLTVGLSMAQSLQLHQMTDQGSAPCTEDSESEAQCTWWCFYVFEKILAFDACRRSRIIDNTLSAIKTWAAPPCHRTELPAPGRGVPHASSAAAYKEALVSLANLLHEIQDRSLHSWGQKELALLRSEDAVAMIIRTAGEIEIMLQGWQDSLPADYHKYIFANIQHQSSLSHHVPFLQSATACILLIALLSYVGPPALPIEPVTKSLIESRKMILYRNSLLRDRAALRQEIMLYGAGYGWQMQISSGPEACAEAAIDMIRLLVTLANSDTTTYASISFSPLLAAYVLVIHIYNEPCSLLARTYFELAKVALSLSREQHRKLFGHNGLEHITSILEGCVLQRLAEAALPEPIQPVSAEDLNADGIFPPSPPNCPTFSDLSTVDWVSWDLSDWQTLQQ